MALTGSFEVHKSIVFAILANAGYIRPLRSVANLTPAYAASRFSPVCSVPFPALFAYAWDV